MAVDPITDFSRTKRVVFLIDLDPLLSLQSADHYLTSIVSSAEAILSFPPLSSSLFSFKPFFSSLSPILSTSKLPSSSLCLSFNDPCNTLRSLSQFLSSLPEFDRSSTSICPPRALNVVALLRQLLHDYSWDSVIDDNSLLGTSSPCVTAVRSNLVVLFSPIGRARDWVSQFIGVEMDDGSLTSADCFRFKFQGIFQNVNSSFVSRDIHCSWIDVKYAPEWLESEGLELILSGIRSLGWGFCSTQSIVFGSVLVPFGLIYPSIGLPSKFFSFSGAETGVRTNFRLEIASVDGKPLECKFCELQLVSFEDPAQCMNNGPILDKESANFHVRIHGGSTAWLEKFMGGIVKVEAVQKHGKFAKIKERCSETMLVQEYLGKSEKDQKDACSSEFFADRILKVITSEVGEIVRKLPPMWQIFLSFMYKEGFWALVSLSNSNGDRCFGVLKPFSVSSALISVAVEKSNLDDMLNSIGVGSSLQFIHKVGNQSCGSKRDVLVDRNESTSLQFEPLANKRHSKLVASKSKKNHKTLRFFQDLSWSEFQKEELKGLDLRLDELYMAREDKSSKKLKFLKCWEKEVKTYTSRMPIIDMSKPQTESPEETENAAAEAHQASEQPIPASDSLSAASRVQGEIALDCGIESSEDVLNDIPDKIRKGLESKGLDMGTLAQRLVNCAIFCLYQKQEMKDTPGGRLPSVNAEDDYLSKVASEVTGLLLREPKDLSEKNKSRDISSQTSDQDAIAYVVREYELQILFRMEILRSEISVAIKDSVRQKFIKQICLLLEYIQCHLERFFGDWSLHNYVGKIIKTRYAEDLEEAVHQIYSKMDLLLFDQEDDMPNSLLNSEEESGQSWRNKTEEGQGEMGKNRCDQWIAAQSESPAPPRKGSNRKKEGHEQRLIRACQRRERARRVASYTSWIPDLQRVWAPKQQANATKVKRELSVKQSKRKDDRSATRDIVCETPMTVNKRSCLQRSKSPSQDSAMQRSGSIPKSLFQFE